MLAKMFATVPTTDVCHSAHYW